MFLSRNEVRHQNSCVIGVHTVNCCGYLFLAIINTSDTLYRTGGEMMSTGKTKSYSAFRANRRVSSSVPWKARWTTKADAFQNPRAY